jgi:hypothetical protein
VSDIYALLEKSGAHPYKGRLYLPAFTSWGAYTLIYLTKEMETLCSDCATTDYFEWLYSLNTCEGWQHDPPVYVQTYDEGPDEICAGCNKPIPSSYGDPDA